MKKIFLTFIVIAFVFSLFNSGDNIDASSSAQPMALSQVKYWAYQIQGVENRKSIKKIVRSKYDMVVIDPTVTYDSDFNAKKAVRQIKNSTASNKKNRKMVIAYIDIGEMEEWRWYWGNNKQYEERGRCKSAFAKQIQSWAPWVVGCDPDGWAGNYPVAYWDKNWKDVVIYGSSLGEKTYYNSMLDEVVKDGFDGVYLDWVEAYDDDKVKARAKKNGVDPVAEMLQLIKEIKQYGQKSNPNFVVIQQNASGLVDEVGIAKATKYIDAIAQEHVWWYGEASDSWRDRDSYNQKIDKDLNNFYLRTLKEYQKAGLPVFNAEYASGRKRLKNIYKQSRNLGFVPYVSRASLSRITKYSFR